MCPSDVAKEMGIDDVTLAIQTLFPSIIVQAQSNTLATRHIIPKGPG